MWACLRSTKGGVNLVDVVGIVSMCYAPVCPIALPAGDNCHN